MTAELSSSIEKLVKDNRLPGVGAIAIDKSGKQLYNEAFGNINANDSSSKAYTNDTQMIFWSCTKFLASIAALQFVELGKLSLDDPVSKYLPEQAKVEVLKVIDEQDKLQTRPAETEMKVVHLFTHTAGYSTHLSTLHSYLIKY